jgi:peroxiredoxin
MQRIGLSFLALIVWVAMASAQDEPRKAPPQFPDRPTRTTSPVPIGPPEVADLAPGDHAPSFELDSSVGHPVSLADLRGHWSILVFDVDHSRFASFAGIDDSIKVMGARLLCVCGDGVGSITSYVERHKLGFTVLSDPTGQISQLFGMYDDQNGTIQAGLVILDQKAIVRMVVQGAPLHPHDVLTMARHALRGT